MTACLVCTRPTPDRMVCQTCGDDLARDLGDVHALSDELETTLARLRSNTCTGGSRSRETPLPYDLGASAALSQLRVVLVGWTRVLLEEHPEPYPADTLVAIAAWLLVRVDVIRDRDYAPDVLAEVSRAIAGARRAIDRHRELVYAGPCEKEDCAEHLYARPRAGSVACPGCGHVHGVEERRTFMLDAVYERLVTPSEAATLLTYFGLRTNRRQTAKLIVTWNQRGRLLAHGVTLDGEVTYRFGEVVGLLAVEQERAS